MTKTALTKVQQSLVNDIRKKTTLHLNEKYKGKDLLLTFYEHTLAHEIGHLEEGLKNGFKLAYIKIVDFVMFVNNDGNLESIIITDYANVIPFYQSGGICYVYADNEREDEALKQAYLKILDAGPQATHEFCTKKELKGFWKKIVLGAVKFNNPSKKTGSKILFKWQSIMTEINDQANITKIMKDESYNEVKKLNNVFKAIGDAVAGNNLDNELIPEQARKVVNQIKGR